MFKALDDQGRPVACGLSLSGDVVETPEGGYCQHGSLSPEEFPKRLTLQAYLCYETVVLKMREQRTGS